MGTRFTVIDNFFCNELQTQYVAGMAYEAGDQDTQLQELIPLWIDEGKVREGGPASEVSGAGEATETKE